MSQPIAMWRQILVSAVLLGGAVAVWQFPERTLALLPLGRADEAAAPAGPRSSATPVIVAPVTLAADDIVLEVVGTGRAERSVMLRSEAAGRIETLALAPNARFEAGDVLLTLDDHEEQLALSLAQTRLREAERIRERVTNLQGRGVAPDARLDEVATAAEVARLEMESARRALEERTLRAPFAGVSGLPAVEAGAWIDSGVDIATFDDRSVLLVEFDVPEAVVSRITGGMAVRARTPAVPGRSFAATVTAIDSRIDEESRTARVRVAIRNEEDLLRPGSSFTITLDLPGETYPVVPELSLLFAREGLHVWRVAGDVAERVPVRLVRRRAGAVLVEGPLEPGELVVVEGTQRLREGREVDVTGTREGGQA